MLSKREKRLLLIKYKAMKYKAVFKVMKTASVFISNAIKSGETFYGPLPGRRQINEMVRAYLHRRDSLVPDKTTLELVIKESLESYGQLHPDLNP